MITKGKWEALEKDGGDIIIQASDKHETFVARVIGGIPKLEQESNDALIAAAPELLEACKGLLKSAASAAEHYNIGGGESIWAWLEDANDAILKATS